MTLVVARDNRADGLQLGRRGEVDEQLKGAHARSGRGVAAEANVVEEGAGINDVLVDLCSKPSPSDGTAAPPGADGNQASRLGPGS